MAFGVLVGALFALYMRYVGREVTLVLLGVCIVLSQVGSIQEFEPLLAAVAAGLVIENLAVAQGDTLRAAVQRGAPPVLVVFFRCRWCIAQAGRVRHDRVRRTRLVRRADRDHPFESWLRLAPGRPRYTHRQVRVDGSRLAIGHHAWICLRGSGRVPGLGAANPTAPRRVHRHQRNRGTDCLSAGAGARARNRCRRSTAAHGRLEPRALSAQPDRGRRRLSRRQRRAASRLRSMR